MISGVPSNCSTILFKTWWRNPGISKHKTMPVCLIWEAAFSSLLPPAWAVVCIPVPLPKLASSDFPTLLLLWGKRRHLQDKAIRGWERHKMSCKALLPHLSFHCHSALSISQILSLQSCFLSSRIQVISVYHGDVCHMLCKWQNMSEQLEEEPKLELDCSGDHKQKLVYDVVFGIWITEIKCLRKISSLDYSDLLGCMTWSKLDGPLSYLYIGLIFLTDTKYTLLGRGTCRPNKFTSLY